MVGMSEEEYRRRTKQQLSIISNQDLKIHYAKNISWYPREVQMDIEREIEKRLTSGKIKKYNW